MLWCLVWICPGTLALADDQAAPVAPSIENTVGSDNPGVSTARFSEARRLEVGMSLEEALALVGKNPDSEEEVGAACGMLDVHTWDKEGTRIISVDGTVTSIVDRNSQQP